MNSSSPTHLERTILVWAIVIFFKQCVKSFCLANACIRDGTKITTIDANFKKLCTTTVAAKLPPTDPVKDRPLVHHIM